MSVLGDLHKIKKILHSFICLSRRYDIGMAPGESKQTSPFILQIALPMFENACSYFNIA